jgi:glycosyltransferase involved in cell wall biosynthesis
MKIENMKKPPFFSIVIPTFNREKELGKALESVMQQTFHDFECLVIDDGSKNPEAIKQEVSCLNDERFSYHHQKNGGACKARNHGIDKAIGRFIVLLDSDDQFINRKLEIVFSYLSKIEEEIFCYSQLFVDRGVDKKWIKPSVGLKNNERMDEYLMCTHGWAQTSTQIISAKLAKKVRFNESLPSSQDTDFAIRCWNEEIKVIFINQPLTIMNDIYDSSRVSKQSNYKLLLTWIESSRGKTINDKAYWGYRGWEIARIASYGNRFKGMGYYLNSLFRFPYSLKMAILIFAQILIPQNTYQRIASTAVSLFGKK